MNERGFLPGQPAVTKEDRRRAWEMGERGHGFQMMLAMDNIGLNPDGVQICDDGMDLLRSCSVSSPI